MRKKFLLILYLFIFIIFQISSFSLCDDINDEAIIDVDADIISSSNIENKSKLPDINSRAYVIIDRNTNLAILGKNENTKRKMASTTKVMTATVIIENCDLNETIEVSKKAAGTGGSRLGLKTGDKITIRDLLYGLMLKSGNDAAVALAEHCGGSVQGFSELMNKKAAELNLDNTNFETPHGLDSDNHYTTAYELAILSNYALNNKTFKQIVGTKNYTVTINGYPKSISNTNELLGNLEGVYGIKTGFTNGANRCLVSACKRDDMDIICVVLGADTKKHRTQDSVKLISYFFNNFTPINIEELIINKFDEWKNENLNNFVINKGTSQTVQLKFEKVDKPIIPIRRDLIDSINISINCKNNFEAPVLNDTLIGNINITIAENSILTYNIYTAQTISRKSSFSYLLELLKKYNLILENCLF